MYLAELGCCHSTQGQGQAHQGCNEEEGKPASHPGQGRLKEAYNRIGGILGHSVRDEQYSEDDKHADDSRGEGDALSLDGWGFQVRTNQDLQGKKGTG